MPQLRSRCSIEAVSTNEPEREGLASLDCAWCSRWFNNVVDLLDHVDQDHLSDAPA
jgi:hypothetical protein